MEESTPPISNVLFISASSSPDSKLNFDLQHQYGWSVPSSANKDSPSKTPPGSIQRAKLKLDLQSESPRIPYHPLDPLTEAEINLTVSIIKNYNNENLVFNYITLKEPKKASLLPYFLEGVSPPVRKIPRKSFVLLLDRARQRTYEVVVDLDRRQVEKWSGAPDGVQPPITLDEMTEAERLAREDPEVIERCRLQGYTDMSLVNGDSWTLPYVEDRPEYRGRRLVLLFLSGRNFPGDNEYAHPFGFIVIVDLNEKRIINIEELPTHEDFDAKNKPQDVVPHLTSNYDPDLRDPSSFRKDLKPVEISQPDGSSYKVTGNEIQWQKFKMRIGFNGREGVVIYNVNYKDGSEVRPLFYRMSIAELTVNYGDPRSPYHNKFVFDEGQYGFGFLTSELRPQGDCLGEAVYFNAVLHNERGEPRRMRRVACVHEEDAGILTKHTDFRTGKSFVVRSQRLALTTMGCLGNYDYLYTWYFYQDGKIEFTVRLTGVLSTNLLAVNATPAGYGTTVFPQVNGQYHQHHFTLRMDPEIDGNKNTAVVSDVVPLPAPTGSKRNPYGQGFTTKSTVLRTVTAARTNISPQTSRTWHIRNPNRKNPYTKEPVAWLLMPWSGSPIMVKQDSPLHGQVEFLDYNTWVTPYNDDQMFPGGYYLNSSGLPEWIRMDPNANIDNTDIVIWHSFGISHVPRTEDFPIMPVESCSVLLKPVNFFKENPALDVPPPQALQRDEL